MSFKESKKHEITSESIAKDVADFTGKIEIIPPGVTAIADKYAYRMKKKITQAVSRKQAYKARDQTDD
ncbi:MAG: hypothetical protein HRU20_23465 [Pseudomonadales bacterium]|nr:hypothetical protein [Pseudomonadales bacterium]